jgi:glutamine---fructose-6-phosphate transaminase (isomerizing)
MCGIVGYSGTRVARPILLSGLRRLEYRGYDSAGIALIEESGGAYALSVSRAVGRVSVLDEVLTNVETSASTGIAHTRWATHGRPTEENAHPHTNGDGTIALVHNGIVENAGTLRTALEKEGYVFRSQTDTEVLVHLIDAAYDGGGLVEAVRSALSRVVGTYGIAVVSDAEPGVLICARQGSPIVVGHSDHGTIVASDAAALVEHTRDVTYLQDGQMVHIRPNQCDVIEIGTGGRTTPAIQTLDEDLDEIEKAGYEHFMLKEIHTQPEALKNTMRGRIQIVSGSARLDGLNLNRDELRRVNRLILAACGTSWHAALIGEYLIEELAGIPVEVEYASEFRYRNPIVSPDSLVFVLSQSGETADTLAAQREAKTKGATVLGICNAVGSTIARETDGGVYLHAGPEIGVASTKAFTSQVTVLTLLALYLGRMRRLSIERGVQIATELQEIPAKIKKAIEVEAQVKELAYKLADRTNFLYLGRSYNYPVALEGALKLKEISYIHAEGYPAAEMKHGPIALVDEHMPVVVLATPDHVYDKVRSNIEEVRARKGEVIAVTTPGHSDIHKIADYVIEVPETLPQLSPLINVVPLQLLAYHIAVARGCSVDQPRNLAKSVTVE